MRLVVLDGLSVNPGDNPWDKIAAFGELTVYDRSVVPEITERAAGADIVLVNKVPLDKTSLQALPELRCICVLATGFDKVDSVAAAGEGVVVCNVPGYATQAVPQFVFALILQLNHQVSMHDAAIRSGSLVKGPENPSCSWELGMVPQIELAGQTMGIVGFGNLGKRVAELAHAFGMAVKVFTPRPGPVPADTPVCFTSLEDVFATCDVVSLHCPLTSDNAQFVNASLLETMRRDALFINTARGGLINEADLAVHLHAGGIRGAALDVVSSEPIEHDNPLLTAPRCLLTPHMAWISLAARKRILDITAGNITAFLKGKPVNAVNLHLM